MEKKEIDQSTMAETRTSSTITGEDDELNQLAAVKDKQIDVLSSMLA